MNRFCKECGKEASRENNICIHCGAALEQEERVTKSEVAKPKEPMSKKKKIIWGSVVGLIIVLVSLNMWANSYFSPQSVQKRFDAALTDADAKKLSKLVVHEDSSSISEQEAKAFLKLLKAEGKHLTDELTMVANHGKFIGIYDKYKMEVVDQLAYYDEMIEGLTFEFNGEEFPEYEADEDYITYGPFAPGIYTVEAKFAGEYGETSMEETLTLDYPYHEATRIGMEIPISMVTFYIENDDQFDTSEAHIILNEEELDISDEGATEEIGPFILDGSQHVKTVVTMPWGEVTSEDIAVDNSEMYITADLIAPEEYKELTETLKDFGEQYLESFAEQSTKPLAVATDSFKKETDKEFDDYYAYSGKLKKIEVDKGSIIVNQEEKTPEITILTRYTVEEDKHLPSETAQLYEEAYTWNVDLSFDEKDEKWLVTGSEYASTWGEMEPTDEIKGENKLYGPSKEAIAKAESKGLEADIEAFIYDYTVASVEAINYRSFDIVEDYITEKGPRKKEARDYIDYLDSKDIYEDLYDTELEKVEEVNDTTWKITYTEEYDIIKPDTSDVKKFRTVIHIKEVDGDYYVDELLETNEI